MTVEIDISRMGLEGQGVGYDNDGNIYFVPGAVTGDRVAVLPARTDKRYRDAELERVIRPAAARVDSACPHFKTCGGCDWLTWEYSAQLAAKESILRHVLDRGALSPEVFHPVLAAEHTFGYRNRIQVRQLGAKVGFYRRGTHDIVDVDHCAVAHPKLNEALRALKARPREALTKFELFVDDRGEVGSLLNVPHGAGGFTQVNPEQNIRLRSVVTEAVRGSGATHVLELFCGNGNLTFSYLPFVSSVYGVDSNRPAIGRAREAAAASPACTARFSVGSADGNALGKMPPEVRERYDTLVLDPPRTGMPEPLDPFLHNGVKTIIYVSCSPVAFAKDVQCLKQGFTFRSVQPIDMFPHTRHIEFVAVFSRRSC